MGKKLLDIMRDKIRFKHYSRKTEQAYIYWAKSYILYHNKKHPKVSSAKWKYTKMQYKSAPFSNIKSQLVL